MRALLLSALVVLPAVSAAEKQMIDNVEVYILRDAARGAEVRIAPSLGMNSY